MRLNWTKINATARKAQLAKLQADIDATPPTPEAPILFYDVLNLYLDKKVTYFIPIRATHLTNELRKATHLATLRMAGNRLATTRHEFSFWSVPADAKQAQDIIHSTPEFTLITKPFVFHDTDAAREEIKRILTLHGQP